MGAIRSDRLDDVWPGQQRRLVSRQDDRGSQDDATVRLAVSEIAIVLTESPERHPSTTVALDQQFSHEGHCSTVGDDMRAAGWKHGFAY